ncbi:hypothetical protein [Tsukamurella columbiensis]|uniref:Uncharacterized protein n=1 Tax=Tsukamurella columbiensis TaxID=128509 RepID=A0ABX1LQF5_9ACTN|nr:hypothetical protein [Tsukamurella columbiensis]NMD58326.1 hypothetical protein [Tsukamurella columbiensis]
MAWEWIGLAAPLAAGAGAAINELTRRGKRDDERLEFARKGLAAAKEDLGAGSALVPAYEREVERALVAGVRVKRRLRELFAKTFGGVIFLGAGIFTAQFGTEVLVQGGDIGTVQEVTSWIWVILGSGFAAGGVGIVLHAQATTSGLRRADDLADVERDLQREIDERDEREIGGGDGSA